MAISFPYPSGHYAALARLKINQVSTAVKKAQLTLQTSPDDARIRILNIIPKYTPGITLKPGRYHIEVTKAGYKRHTEWLDLEVENKIHSVVLQEKTVTAASSPRQNRNLPIKVTLPKGFFQMGSPAGEKERDDEQHHRVCINQPFQMGVKEVTVGEFRRFVQATGYRTAAENNVKEKGCYAYSSDENEWAYRAGYYWDKVGFNQTDQHPVTCISWFDSQKYISRLNQNSTGGYRMPTEAEWEYAARAGTTTPFYTGNCINTDQANYNGEYDYNGCGAEAGHYRKNTIKVGSFPANPWGLYDMAGNVWEWTCSEYDKSYSGGESQCLSTNRANNDSLLARRGGPFSDRPRWVRSAYLPRAGPWRHYAT